MQFALNYSPQAFDLVKDGTIDIDLFKCSSDYPEHIDIAKAVRPVYVHFSLQAGPPGKKVWDFGSIENILSQTSTHFVNMHLAGLREHYPDIATYSTNAADRDRLIEQMIDDIRAVTDHFGPDRVILENYPYHARARSDNDILLLSADSFLINNVLEETGCGFLFDIDHARVAAHYLGQEPFSYIQSLPLKKTQEFHMTGTRMADGWLQSHLSMQKEDWEYFAWALDAIQSKRSGHPSIMAFEYGGTGPAFDWRSDTRVIAEQVPEFRRLIHERHLASS